ncbi:MAG: T9SS type A sorting domain-containing protein [Dyadobacter sp.]|uniref:sialate O-acetylesterase n=1 Tax=Dyadobacter sp. TaxID=1914288 RepID=UPI001B19B532|nr:sialate O-acetylesterase [Dyadobacter sp.]MBO9615576.1 T9SS type A sorting domain-containing protein [Dyadobacter sp.]
MRYYSLISLLIAVLLTGSDAFSQISISWPVDKTVFQRGVNNSFWIAGQCLISNSDYQLQYRVKSINLETGLETGAISIDWTTFEYSRPYGGIFSVQVYVSPGMYNIEIRAINNGFPMASGGVSVGLGEVFIISGQSNAQGVASVLPADPVFKGVVSDTRDEPCDLKLPPFPSMFTIDVGSKIGMRGPNNWCYSRLGKKISQNKNVPVAFFNAAIANTGLRNWIDGINGVATTSTYGQSICSGNIGAPYKILKNALNYYGSMFGVRGVLWHQGENDAHDEWAGLTTSAQYQTRLNTLINTSRSDFNANLIWYISRVSRNNETGGSFQPTNPDIITAQNAVAGSNKYGPATDNIQPVRPDKVHFSGTGLIDLGDAWYNELNNGNFSGNSSIQASTFPQVTASANGGNVTLTAPAGYSIYRWVSGQYTRFDDPPFATTQSITVSSGVYRCYMAQAGNKNVVVSQAIYTPLPSGSFRMSAEEIVSTVDYDQILHVSPNPANDQVNIEFGVNSPATVRLEIVDERGVIMTTIADNYHAAGAYQYPFNMTNLPAGAYICRVKIGDLFLSKKFVKLSR